MSGWAFVRSGDRALVYASDDGAIVRDPSGTFTEWMTAELERISAWVASVDEATIAQMTAEGEEEDDPHRLIDYSIDKTYELPAG